MARLEELIGVETDLSRLSGVVEEYARTVGAAVVGGYQVICSDEAEWECAEAFQQSFAQMVLPALKPGRRAVLRSVNLGARYEVGALRLAEDHFAAGQPPDGFKLMVAKVNSHVAVQESPEGMRYGWIERYDSQSPCCGALAALLAGGDLPAVQELRELFASDGKDRLPALSDPAVVPDEHRPLAAAMVNAWLQARSAVRDVQQRPPEGPTVFLVLPCVTVNRPGPDTEVLLGRYEIDWTGPSPTIEYQGLGDDPAAYQIRHRHGRLHVTDLGQPGERLS